MCVTARYKSNLLGGEGGTDWLAAQWALRPKDVQAKVGEV